jgi:thiamine biosynthesis lipoprotein
MRQKTLIIIAMMLVLLQSGCSGKASYKKSALLMGTFVEIQAVPPRGMSEESLQQALEGAFREIRKVEKVFSLYDAGSELRQLHVHGVDRPYKVSHAFVAVLKKAFEYHHLTQGAFDISIAPLAEFWRDAATSGRMPEDAALAPIRDLVGMERVILDEENGTVALPAGMKLDFGGLAKGYAVDTSIAGLRHNGITTAVVSAGGDMYCLGNGLDGVGWRIGIRHPEERSDYVATLILRDRAVATSGSYERYYRVNDTTFSHIIDPHTGMPLVDPPASVTVVADDCSTADALATAVYVLGSEKGIELLDSLPYAEGVIISKQNMRYIVEVSRGLKEIELHEQEK